jgi:hypothetical protein
MIVIRFPDATTERRGLGWLAGRFSFTTWSSGDVLVPEPALAALAHEGIRFSVEGPPTYEHALPAVRAAGAATI